MKNPLTVRELIERLDKVPLNTCVYLCFQHVEYNPVVDAKDDIDQDGRVLLLIPGVEYFADDTRDRLSAAAPELLAALEEAIGMLKMGDDGSGWTDEAVAEGEAAIAKARGEKP